MATVKLVPTPGYFPLRLRCIRALNKMAQASGCFTPVAPLLLDILSWSGLSKAARSGGKPPSEAVPQLKASKQVLESVAYQQALVDEVQLPSGTQMECRAVIIFFRTDSCCSFQ